MNEQTSTNIWKETICCPFFPGFYETFLSEYYSHAERVIEYFMETYKGEKTEDQITEVFHTISDTADAETASAREWTVNVRDHIDTYLPNLVSEWEFVNVESPCEYNFRNDEALVRVALDLDKLLFYVNKYEEAVSDALREAFTSCSGFMSFHEPSLDHYRKPDGSAWQDLGRPIAEAVITVMLKALALASYMEEEDDTEEGFTGAVYMDWVERSNNEYDSTGVVDICDLDKPDTDDEQPANNQE